MTKVFLDMDGVLANFDKAAERILDTDNIYKFEFIYGPKEFWRRLDEAGAFFLDLEPMQDVNILLKGLKDCELEVLTALPVTNAEFVAHQKKMWIAKHIDPTMPVIACKTFEKPNYCEPGSFLIDDRAVNKAAWENNGGYFILHTTATNSLYEIESILGTRL